MVQSIDHPELQYIQAAGYTVGRGGFSPIWIVVHDMEAGEHSGRAESTALYFANPGDGRNVSAHYCVDNDSVVQCVRLKDTAWTVGNQPGNQRGINWELAGFARQTRAEWLDAFGVAMFHQMAPIVRADAAKYNIPLVRRSVAELRAFKPGVTSHNDLREAFNVTTHTDPGPAFPWDVFLSIMNGEDEVAGYGYATQEQANDVWRRTGSMQRTLSETVVPKLDQLLQELATISSEIEALTLAVAAVQTSVDNIDCGDSGGGGGSGPLTLTGQGTFVIGEVTSP